MSVSVKATDLIPAITVFLQQAMMGLATIRNQTTGAPTQTGVISEPGHLVLTQLVHIHRA